MVKRWMAGDDVLPQGYTTYRENGKTPGLVEARRLIHHARDRIHVAWVKGHQGEPLNEGADALARLASRYALGRSGLDADEYRRRAEDLAKAFSAEFNRLRSA
jgi:ribonuclease HI